MKQKIHEYQSDDIIVSYDVVRCIHAAECVRGLPQAFDPQKKPWIQPDKAAADEVAEVVIRCPTGALKFERTDGGATESTPTENVIVVSVDGPLYARGNIKITSQNETLLEDTRLAFCRCGVSKNKPLCDNAHQDIEFTAPGTANEPSKMKESSSEDNQLTVQVLPNGPLLFRGPVEIRSAQGQAAFQMNEGALCRCGASENKPFCDGNHKQIGFEAE